MPFPPTDKARFIALLAKQLGLPVTEVKARVRPIAEAGLVPLGIVEEFRAIHAVAIILGIIAAPSHVDAAATVARYGAFPCRGIEAKSGHVASFEEIGRLFPGLATGATLQDILLVVLDGLAADDPAFAVVDGVWCELPPHDRAGLRIRPRGLLPVDIVFSAETGVAGRMKPEPERRLKRAQSFDGTVLSAVAEFFTPAGKENRSDDDEDEN